MLLAPAVDDLRVIIRISGTGVLLFGLGIGLLAIPALLLGEANAATAMLMGAAPAVVTGVLARRIRVTAGHLTWTRGIVIAATTWAACALVATIPLQLSGHFASPLDALFDAVSGLTNTGNSLIADLDHLPRAFILLRSWLEIAGGAAFLLVGQSLLAARRAIASSLTPAETVGEHFMPRTRKGVVYTARTLGALGSVGIVGVGVSLVIAGVPLTSLPVSTVSLTVAAATTGGFVPVSGAVGAYHSPVLEFMLVTLMLGAATSVGVLGAAARRQYRRIARDLNFRSYVVMLLVVIAGVAFGLARAGTFTTPLAVARHAIFSGTAAVTTTGLSTVAPQLFMTDFGIMAPIALVAGMTVGGMLGSLSGGFTTLRGGLLAKGVIGDVRRILQPEGSVQAIGWQRLGRREVLTDAHVRSSASIVMLALITILAGGAVVLWSSGTVTLRGALMTSASAVGNVGLDVGVLASGQPWYVTLVFTAMMLLGRLQWLAVFAAVGFAVSTVWGRP